MKAVNLHLLTRVAEPESMSMLFQALSERGTFKAISPHEASSLKSLTDMLISHLGDNPLPLLDGFFFSYVIDHIGKEFDLLKVSSDGECVVNIELKSEDIGGERIRRQLEQNRYYLSHSARTIYSFTYVSDTGTFYRLSSRGHFAQSQAQDLAQVLKKEALKEYLKDGIDRFFRASDYLISPVAFPDRFLQGQYFLTNQQFDFRKRILAHLEQEPAAVISFSGPAGTGKTLLLFDLAMALSKKDPVLFIHAGPLRKGHTVLDGRLKNVKIRSGKDRCPGNTLSKYHVLLIDEADRLGCTVLEDLLSRAARIRIPVIMAYDPHHLLHEQWVKETSDQTAERIASISTLSLEFSGNIRINRPVYSFLRTLLNLKDHAGSPDYSCIDILYANDQDELRKIAAYYQSMGYEMIGPGAVQDSEKKIIAQEYSRVLMILGDDYYYDSSLHLRTRSGEEEPLRLLYEGLSRTRENLCLLIPGSRELFLNILSIRLHRPVSQTSLPCECRVPGKDL